MGRPLTGTVKPLGTRFRASCPAELGSRRRVEPTFRTERAAEKWRTAALADLVSGGTVALPTVQERALLEGTAPTRKRPASQPRAIPSSTGPVQSSSVTTACFASIAEEWVTERYTTGWKGDAIRESDIRNKVSVIDDNLTRHELTLENLTRPAAQAFLVHLARGTEATASTHLPEGLDPASEVTVGRAAQLPLMPSLSSIKRRLKPGGGLPSRLVDGHRLITVADLYSADAGLLGAPDGNGTPAGLRRGPRREVGYSDGVIRSYWQVLHNVWAYAASEGLPINGHLLDGMTIPVSDRPRPEPRRPVELATCAVLAVGLHSVHQLTLWLMRILGLRISEAHGILVGDVLDNGAGNPGVIMIRAQGGRTTTRRDRRTGQIRFVDRVEGTKTLSSVRTLLIPPSLMNLLRVSITAFHTDVTSGEVTFGARLVPGLGREDLGGQSALRSSLKRTGAELSLGDADDMDDVFSTQPHDLRKSQLPYLARKNVAEIWRRRFGGHTAGHSVAERAYVLDDPQVRPLLELTALIESEITAELPGGLAIATAQRCTTGSQPALAPRRYLRTGEIPSVVAARLARGAQRRARWDDVQAFKCSQDGWTTATELAHVVGRTLRVVTDHIAHAGVASELRGGVRLLAPDAVSDVVAHFEAQVQLAERSMPLAGAKSTLGVPLLVVHHLIEQGELIENSHNAAGSRTVTRGSVAMLVTQRRPRRRTSV